MAEIDYTESTKRAELNAALAVLKPQLKGLADLRDTSISPDLKQAVIDQITARTHRQDLIHAALAALDAANVALTNLNDDDYPNLPTAPVPGSLFAELQEEKSDLAAAMSVFASENITAGALSQSPNPTPPTAPGP